MDTWVGVVLQAHTAVVVYNTDGSMSQRRDKRRVFNLFFAVAYECNAAKAQDIVRGV